jgi:peroxiredoxin
VSAHSATASVGAPAPDFTAPKVGGGELTLSARRGSPVVLVFLRGFA